MDRSLCLKRVLEPVVAEKKLWDKQKSDVGRLIIKVSK
jgi:hypothetical protein